MKFGYRKIALFGGLTTFVSMILCAFATSPNLLSLSYALLGGIGDSSTILLPLLIVSEYFQKRRGFVTGLFLFGSSGTFFIAPLVPSYLLQHYDYQGASLICAAIVLNQCVGAMLFQPVEWHMKLIKREQLTEKILNEENNSEYRHSEDKIDLEVFNIIPEENNFKMNNSSCVTGCMTRSKSQKSVSQIQLMANKINVKTNHNEYEIQRYVYQGYINFQMWIPFIITDAGYSLESAAWCSSLVVIGDMSGKLTSSVLADRKFFNVSKGDVDMAYRATLWLLKRFSFPRSKHQKGRCLEADCQSEIKIKENSFLWIQEKFSHNDNFNQCNKISK
ncbi:Monocarboxylate transporter 2 [Armadillidium vulgare]|nr:Monocarboxylate transporter 2 [Armadillidium vulgare]